MLGLKKARGIRGRPVPAVPQNARHRSVHPECTCKLERCRILRRKNPACSGAGGSGSNSRHQFFE